MKLPQAQNYYVYIVTNPDRKVLYIGVTNDLLIRVAQHKEQRGKPDSFAGKYYCFHLIYYEWFQNIEEAIKREKQIKKWIRAKKEDLIAKVNPDWFFVLESGNEDTLCDICGNR